MIFRRKTSLPEPPHYVHTASMFSDVMKACFLGPVRDTLQNIGQSFIVPIYAEDPWDSAVKWIERNEAAKAEWPWPERRG
jgi:hypothetical protein